jgi:hypothetical protein
VKPPFIFVSAVLVLFSQAQAADTRHAFNFGNSDDLHHDGGELLPITTENAKAVNDAIWQVLANHPLAGLKQQP